MKANKTLHLSSRKNQAGNAVLGVLAVMVGIGITLNIVVTNSANQSSQVLQNARVKWSRNSIAYQIERSASLPATFRTSLSFPENAQLQSCVLGAGGLPCRGDGTEYPLSLYVAPNSDSGLNPAVNTPTQITGSNPVLYNTKGQRCQNQNNQASRECPFEVSTRFTAQCAGAVSTCAVAESIRVHYTIRIPASVNSSGSTLQGQMVVANLQKSAAVVQTKSIYPPANNYVPNSINTIVMITEGSGAGFDINGVEIPSSKRTPLTVDQIYEEVRRTIGYANSQMAVEIANNIAWSKSMDNKAAVRIIAELWAKNPSAGRGVVGRTHDMFLDDNATGSEVLDYVKDASNAVSWIEDPEIAYQIAQQGIRDESLARSIHDTIIATGATDKPSVTAIVDGSMTDVAMAKAVAATVASSGMKQDYQLAAFAYAVKEVGDISAPSLENLARLIVAVDMRDWDIARVVLAGGITDESIVREMHAKGQAAQQAKIETVVSVVTPTPAPAVAPVSMTVACVKVSDCGTSVGM